MPEHLIQNLVNGKSYYAKVYTRSPSGRLNTRGDLPLLCAIPSLFPQQPADEKGYRLISDYTVTQEFTAPEDGWFLIEVHGASGSGGNSGLSSVSWYTTTDDEGERMYGFKTGGSGAGGSYGASIVKLRRGDLIRLTIGSVGETTLAEIHSSAGISYETITVEAGGSGRNASTSAVGSAGLSGEVSGGNLYNLTGSNGRFGNSAWNYERDEITVAPRTGGEPGHPDGNHGGASAYCTSGTHYPASPGKPGFVRISRGETNVVSV